MFFVNIGILKLGKNTFHRRLKIVPLRGKRPPISSFVSLGVNADTRDIPEPHQKAVAKYLP